jgi:hypothetical protein
MAGPIERVILWDRGNDLALAHLLSELVDDLGVPLTQGDVSAMEARVYTAGTAEPPVAMAGRSAVTMTFDGTRNAWRGSLQYGSDLDALSEVRVIVTVTVASRTQRLMDAQARFARPDGR